LLISVHPQIKVSVNLQHVEINLLLEINNHRNLHGMLEKKQKTNNKYQTNHNNQKTNSETKGF